MFSSKYVFVLFLLNFTACSKIVMNKYETPDYNWFYSLDTLDLSYPKRAISLDKEYEDLKEEFYRSWENRKRYNSNEHKWGIEYFKRHKIFGENKKEYSSNFLKEISINLNSKEFPSINKDGITIDYCDLKIVPTLKPIFYDFEIAGEGFPFDNNQNSSLWPNTPVKIIHESKDGRWVFISCAVAVGWIEKNRVAFVDKATKQKIKKMELISVNRDELSVYSKDDIYLHQAMLGSLYPIDDSGRIFAFSKDEKANAIVFEIKLNKNDYNVLPKVIAPSYMKQLMANLLGNKYGWGGLYENRDCSSTLRDLYLSFGVMIPRSSLEQKRAGEFISFNSLDVSQRKKIIKKRGVPFRTLFHKKGHIMMYVGYDKNRIYMFHNVWGIKTEDEEKNYGRIEIGKTVITDVELGKDVPFVKKSFLEDFTGMTILFNK